MNATLVRPIRLVAWLFIALIVYATLTDVNFIYRLYHRLAPFLHHPGMRTFAHVEHVVAFLLFGLLFGLAYRRPIVVGLFVASAALALEFLQTLTPDRHGTAIDAIEKMIGGLIGVGLAGLYLMLAGRRRSRPAEAKAEPSDYGPRSSPPPAD